MSMSSQQLSATEVTWEGRLANEVRAQGQIEAAFDRADASERAGEFEHALEWLDRAEALSGDLSPAYRAQRERLACRVTLQRAPAPGVG
ncbi:MAG: hypothetical protein QOH58_41 [Thermoleophilaceae bacterium]|jgi:hypothetical protein|nr:hypothetical protein [Thermoleophilaceae bacterium]